MERKEFLHETAHNNVCVQPWVTVSWFLERDTADEFFRCSFWHYEHHTPSAIYFHYIWGDAELQISATHTEIKEKYVFFSFWGELPL